MFFQVAPGVPLICQQNGRWYVTGLHSFKVELRSENRGIYTHVPSYKSWINSVTSSNHASLPGEENSSTEEDYVYYENNPNDS